MNEGRFWLAERRGTLTALAIFLLMFTIYVSNHPAGLTANVIQTAANKGVLLAFVAMAQALVVITAGIDLSVGMIFILTNCLASWLVVGSFSETALGVLRKHRDELDAERLAANPGRHRQETGGRAVDADLVGLPQRHRLAVAPEGLAQCFDQLGKGKRGMDVGSGVTAQHRYHPVPIMKVR